MNQSGVAEQARVLVQVFPPGAGGVSDYVSCLKAQWDVEGVPSHSIALSKEAVVQRSLSKRIENLMGNQACTVVLHYSGYGYGSRGVCFWLLDELTRLRRQRRDGLRLVVVFHELFASGPPWRTAFWLSRVQALIAARLARSANALWTNTEQHADWLRHIVGPATSVQVRPVFSNIGEPEAVPVPDERQAHVVVFGSASTRQRAFDALRGHERALHSLGITELIEVGGGDPSAHLPDGLACRHAGRLEPRELSALLQSTRFGLLDYPPQFLAKSGVFAAYAAHGCTVLNTCANGPDTDALQAGRDYLMLASLARSKLNTGHDEARAARLTRWYAGHRLSYQAREILALATTG